MSDTALALLGVTRTFERAFETVRDSDPCVRCETGEIYNLVMSELCDNPMSAIGAWLEAAMAVHRHPHLLWRARPRLVEMKGYFGRPSKWRVRARFVTVPTANLRPAQSAT